MSGRPRTTSLAVCDEASALFAERQPTATAPRPTHSVEAEETIP